MTEQEMNLIEDLEIDSMAELEEIDSAETDTSETSLEDEFTFPNYECFR